MTSKRRTSRHPGIRQLESGAYQVLFRDTTGRQRAQSFPVLADARAFQDATRAELRRGAWRDPAGAQVHLAEWVTLWLETRRVRPTTAAKTRTILHARILPRFGTTPLGRITRRSVQTWVQDLEGAGLSAARVQSCYALLSQILAEAVTEDLIAQTPCRGIRFDPSTRPSRQPRALDTAEAARLLEALEGPGRVLVLVALGTGLRWGEVTGLRRGRVHLLHRPPYLEVTESLHEAGGRRYFGSPKTRASLRRVPLPRALADALATHLPLGGDAEDLVFTARGGTPWWHANFASRIWAPARRQAGLDGLRFHDLRHTYASILENAGVPRVVTAELLGHRGGGGITTTYVHAFQQVVNEAVELVDAWLQAALGGHGHAVGEPSG